MVSMVGKRAMPGRYCGACLCSFFQGQEVSPGKYGRRCQVGIVVSVCVPFWFFFVSRTLSSIPRVRTVRPYGSQVYLPVGEADIWFMEKRKKGKGAKRSSVELHWAVAPIPALIFWFIFYFFMPVAYGGQP